MKRTLAALTVLAAAILVTPLAAQPAQAGGGLYVEIGDHGKKHHNKKHWHKKHHNKKHWHKKHHEHHGGSWGGFVLNLGTPYYQQPARPCHAVERDGYFRGRYARIAETVCYNGHGRPYVVDGSSYVVHFY